MPDKNPENYTLLTYLGFGLLSVWGGLVTHILRIRQDGKAFIWREAFLQVTVSGFAGMLSMLLCWHLTAPVPLAGFMAGISGYMGSRALSILENRANKLMGN